MTAVTQLAIPGPAQRASTLSLPKVPLLVDAAWARRHALVQRPLPNGGRHVYIPVAEPIPFPDAREAAELFGRRGGLPRREGRAVDLRRSGISLAMRRGGRHVCPGHQVHESLDKIDSLNFFLWIDVAKQGDAPPRATLLRGLPGYVHKDAGWKVGFRAVPKSPDARGAPDRHLRRRRGSVGPRTRSRFKGALTDKGSAYGSLSAPFVVAVASSTISLDDDGMLNVLYGSKVLEIHTHRGHRRGSQGRRLLSTAKRAAAHLLGGGPHSISPA